MIHVDSRVTELKSKAFSFAMGFKKKKKKKKRGKFKSQSHYKVGQLAGQLV